jgi:hypothetical protein
VQIAVALTAAIMAALNHGHSIIVRVTKIKWIGTKDPGQSSNHPENSNRKKIQMPTNCNIAFDLDGVLIDLVSVLRKKLPELCGCEFVDTNAYRITTNPVISNAKLWKAFDAIFEDYKNFPIFEGAEDLCRILFTATNDPIRIVTSRPIRAATATHKLIQRFCKVPYVCIITGNHAEKYRYLTDYCYFVEDRRATAIDLAVRGKHVFLVDRGYNRPCAGPRISRIEGVHELIPMINQLVVHHDTEIELPFNSKNIPYIFSVNQRDDGCYINNGTPL